VETWTFFDITHRDHVVCNPLSLARLDEMIGLLDLAPGARVLDIACGKGELLVRLVERYGVRAVGVDLSPFSIRDARALAAARVPEAELELLLLDGADYRSEAGSFDLACCLGASWTFGGHEGTLRALADLVRPGGQVLVGEPFWRQPPDPEYLAAAGLRADEFGTHASNVEVGARLGLTPTYALAGDETDFDRYEALQWRAVDRHACENPLDPDAPELVERVARERRTYLTWGRATLGWALYLYTRT
jgi:SAM-dependent methyltransferase